MLKRQTISAAAPVEIMLAEIPKWTAPSHLSAASIAAAHGATSFTSAAIAKGAIKMILWSHVKAATILGAGAIALGTLAIGAHSLVCAQIHAAPQASAAPAAATVGTSHRAIAQLKDGPSIELLGVAERDDSTHEPLEWWAADGLPLDFGPYEKMTGISLAPTEAGQVEREFGVRVNTHINASTEEASEQWQFLHAASAGSATPQDEHGNYLQNIDGLLARLPDDPKGATLHADFATGPWNTTMIRNADGTASMSTGTLSFLTSECFDVRGQARMVVTVSFDHPADIDVANRVIATTTAGNTVQGYISSASGSQRARIMEIAFTVPSAKIKEIRLQDRPWNKWVEIRHISLHADKPTNIEIASSDQPGAKPTP